jgi:predicted ester cyclase
MLYPEFGQYKSYVDPTNSLVNAYETKEGHLFYVEPGFYYALQGFKEKRRDDFPKILKAIDQVIADNPKVVFTGNFESPFITKPGFVYREITDITDPLEIFVEDKSRGSDYGD